MEDLNVVDSINGAGTWLVRNQALLLSYAVNIVAAIAIIIIGLIVARVISNTVNRLMRARHIDATVADFLSALVRYGVIAFTLIAALGRVGVQTASVIAVLGAAGLAVGLALQGSLSNLAAGVLLVMFRPFRAGEYVDLGGVCRYGTECANLFHNNARGRRQNYCNSEWQNYRGKYHQLFS